jgi:diaminopimelate epimerase
MGKVRPGPEVPSAVVARLADPGPANAHRYATADIGNPHLVVEVDDPAAVDLPEVGAWIEQRFPEGINVELVPRRDTSSVDEIDMRVWERGAGETQACGTGACAVAAVLRDWGVTAVPDGEADTVLEVHMPGGDAQVRLSGEGELALSGDVHLVATVELPDD